MKDERSKFIVNEYIMKIDVHNVVGFAEFVDANAMDQVIEHIRREDINDSDERLGVKVSIFPEIELQCEQIQNAYSLEISSTNEACIPVPNLFRNLTVQKNCVQL